MESSLPLQIVHKSSCDEGVSLNDEKKRKGEEKKKKKKKRPIMHPHRDPCPSFLPSPGSFSCAWAGGAQTAARHPRRLPLPAARPPRRIPPPPQRTTSPHPLAPPHRCCQTPRQRSASCRRPRPCLAMRVRPRRCHRRRPSCRRPFWRSSCRRSGAPGAAGRRGRARR